ncbi:hypothetical protein BDN70DRAFT_897514 [Pholiota conissans]|uniref:Uncharacterized protein n=1 Tax=Pholiota conissans TaxID=109636 RepID=A0A9P5YV03_9AGAR|nr:hypothetical protein BDN70DRAFT_897514 [Pholiota conissans]
MARTTSPKARKTSIGVAFRGHNPYKSTPGKSRPTLTGRTRRSRNGTSPCLLESIGCPKTYYRNADAIRHLRKHSWTDLQVFRSILFEVSLTTLLEQERRDELKRQKKLEKAQSTDEPVAGSLTVSIPEVPTAEASCEGAPTETRPCHFNPAHFPASFSSWSSETSTYAYTAVVEQEVPQQHRLSNRRTSSAKGSRKAATSTYPAPPMTVPESTTHGDVQGIEVDGARNIYRPDTLLYQRKSPHHGPKMVPSHRPSHYPGSQTSFPPGLQMTYLSLHGAQSGGIQQVELNDASAGSSYGDSQFQTAPQASTVHSMSAQLANIGFGQVGSYDNQNWSNFRSTGSTIAPLAHDYSPTSTQIYNRSILFQTEDHPRQLPQFSGQSPSPPLLLSSPTYQPPDGTPALSPLSLSNTTLELPSFNTNHAPSMSPPFDEFSSGLFETTNTENPGTSSFYTTLSYQSSTFSTPSPLSFNTTPLYQAQSAFNTPLSSSSSSLIQTPYSEMSTFNMTPSHPMSALSAPSPLSFNTTSPYSLHSPFNAASTSLPMENDYLEQSSSLSFGAAPNYYYSSFPPSSAASPAVWPTEEYSQEQDSLYMNEMGPTAVADINYDAQAECNYW